MTLHDLLLAAFALCAAGGMWEYRDSAVRRDAEGLFVGGTVIVASLVTFGVVWVAR